MEKKSALPFKVRRRVIPRERVLERQGFYCRFSVADTDELAPSIGHPEISLLFPPLLVVAEDRPPLSPTQRYDYIVHGYRRVAPMRRRARSPYGRYERAQNIRIDLRRSVVVR